MVNTTYLTSTFKSNLHDWIYLNSTNSSANIPVLSLYIGQISKTLISMAYIFQSRYHILIYNPLETEDSLYFSQNPLFLDNKYIMANSFSQLNNSLNNCLSVCDYCSENYADAYTPSLYDYISRIQSVVNLLLTYFSPNSGVIYDPNTTAFQIGYNSTTIFI